MNQREAAERVEPSELTEHAAGMLESALAADDPQGISEALSLFDEVELLDSAAWRGGMGLIRAGGIRR